MENTLLKLVSEIKAELEYYDDQMQSPAQVDSLKALCQESERRLSYKLPDAYLNVLALHDGISCNGIQLYASQTRTQRAPEGGTRYLFEGIVEANEQWREYEPNKYFVFLAESGDRLYCHNLASGKFEIVDRITKELDDESDAFNTCEDLLRVLFNHMLDRYGEKEA